MKITRLKQTAYLTVIAIMITFSAVAQAQVRAYRVTDRQVQTLLDRIENRTNNFRNEIDRALDNSNIDNTNREDSINQMVANFENATDQLKNNFSERRSSSNDVQEVLNRAVLVNSFMRNNRVTTTAQSQWNLIRTDLNTLAGYYTVRTNWSVITPPIGTQTGYYATDYQMRTLLDRIKSRGTAFRQSFDRANRYGRGNQTEAVRDVYENITEFERAVIELRNRFSNRSTGNTGVEAVLRPSATINSYIVSNRMTNDVTNKWTLVRNDLNTLTGYYRMSWDWNNINTNYPGGQYGDFDSQLTGTYRLNTAQSDNVTSVVDRAIINANYNENQGERVRRNLERRLLSPETLTLEKRGQQVTMSSANAAAVTLTADGVVRTETSPNGRVVSVTVTATNRELTINYEGDRINDYYVSFAPASNGQLRVTRRLYLENQNQTVTATSVYDKTDPMPLWNTATYPVGGVTSDGFVVPNNTSMVATLNTPLSTRTSRDADRFSMTVNSPSQYNGAVIEGRVVGEKSGIVSGRANLSLSFETIRLRDGRTYRFAGIVDQVREPNGNMVNVNNEGAIRDSNQTTKTITRAGIGAVIGAIIGAIAGGGEGAAIGAGVGAGAGAGTVILQGRDNLELGSGTQFSITAMAPANVGSQ